FTQALHGWLVPPPEQALAPRQSVGTVRVSSTVPPQSSDAVPCGMMRSTLAVAQGYVVVQVHAKLEHVLPHGSTMNAAWDSWLASTIPNGGLYEQCWGTPCCTKMSAEVWLTSRTVTGLPCSLATSGPQVSVPAPEVPPPWAP